MTVPLPPITPGTINPIYLRDLVGKAASVILDVGANDGLTTLELLKRFPKATIYAFEPDARAFEKFKKNVSDPRVSAFQIAIGAKDGEAEFNVSSGLPPNMPSYQRIEYPTGWDRSGSLRAPKTCHIFWPWVKFEKKTTVQVKRLDSWARENSVHQIDLIWADVQGAEGDLIAGGAKTLANTRFFYTEYSNLEWYEGQPNLNQIMNSLPNFHIVRRFTEDVLLKNTAIQSSSI